MPDRVYADPVAPPLALRAAPSGRGLSIRARLAFWYTLAFGVLLGMAGVATYGLFARIIEHDSESYLTDTAEAVVASLELALRTVPSSLPDSQAVASWAALRTVDNHRYRDIGVAIFRPENSGRSTDGIVLLATDTTSAATRAFGGQAGWREASRSAARARALMQVDIVRLSRHEERVVALPVRTSQGVFVVAASQSTAGTTRLLARIRRVMVLGVLLVLAVSALGGYLLTAASLQPVDLMRAQAERITATNLHERLPVSRSTDELARLSVTFNALLDRVEEAFAQRRQFTADASHELRTPVAIVIGECEVALAADRSPEAYRSALQVIHGEARRLARIVADLFLLARGDAAEQVVDRRPLYLEELVSDCVDAMASLARSKSLILEFSPVSEVPIIADDHLLRRAVMNLLDNAIKYTPDGGRVTVSTEPLSAGGGRVRVVDTGPGIPPAHRTRIFERFFRVQHTTQRGGLGDVSGAGLGLPIVAWIAEAHGGRLALTESGPGGSTFELLLSGG